MLQEIEGHAIAGWYVTLLNPGMNAHHDCWSSVTVQHKTKIYRYLDGGDTEAFIRISLLWLF